MVKIAVVCLLLLAACAPAEGGSGICAEIWCECPGAVAYRVAESAADLQQEVREGVRYYSYFNCQLGKRTPTLNVDAACSLSFRY